MKPRLSPLSILLGVILFSAHPTGAMTVSIFSTQFEVAEGYDKALELSGQNGWLISGSGGNGILSNYFSGSGQQAYVGFFPPDPGDDELFVWKPINYSPIAANTPVVTFSALIGFTDSTTNGFDDFAWSVYNSDAEQLFTLDFNNYDLFIYYALDGTNAFVSTGVSFTHETDYQLAITMNFASNSWSATLNGTVLVTNKAITTTGAKLDLADVDAIWLVFDPDAPGDNFMVFDNYRITTEITPPRLKLLERTPTGNVSLQLEAASGARFAIDGTTDFSNWTPLRTNTVTDGFFDFVDTTATALTRRFYRARWVP